jgi:peptidoglycan/LPS O-acetylase OafA/YrhL
MLESQPTRRHSALDLSRFLAALIVFIGHFVWFDQRFIEWQENQILGLFNSGNQSVLYFFALSGYVLSISAKKIGLRWLFARIFRLMPVYLVCFIFPLILVRVMAPEEYASYSQVGILLGLFASQSLLAQFYLSGANSPLWSLSVEIWLSIGLLALHRMNKNYLLLLLLITSEILNQMIFQPIIDGLSFFLIGILFARINRYSIFKVLHYRFSRTIFLALTIAYWLAVPYLTISVEPKRSLDLVGVCATLLLFGGMRLAKGLDRVGYHLGVRSYSLYAVHGPILRLHSELFDEVWGQQLSTFQLWFYFFSCIAIVALATEIIFKYVELPAMRYAKRLRALN